MSPLSRLRSPVNRTESLTCTRITGGCVALEVAEKEAHEYGVDAQHLHHLGWMTRRVPGIASWTWCPGIATVIISIRSRSKGIEFVIDRTVALVWRAVYFAVGPRWAAYITGPATD